MLSSRPIHQDTQFQLLTKSTGEELLEKAAKDGTFESQVDSDIERNAPANLPQRRMAESFR